MGTALFRPGDRPWLHVGLLAATLLSTFGTFQSAFGGGWFGFTPDQLLGSFAFSLSLVLILGAHEMGHYVLARIHRVDTSLPYFIPLPLLGLGTLGAVIRIRGRIPSRNALVDIGAAGPLAGLVVAIPVIAYGLSQSTIGDAPPLSQSFPGETSLWVLIGELIRWGHEKLAGAPPTPSGLTRVTFVFGDNLLMLGLQRLVLGPIPIGKDVHVHPMVIAGWAGLLVTMLNLIPIGQLDGGHILHAVFGSKARLIGKVVAALMLGACLFVSAGWLLWLAVTTAVIGFGHPEVLAPTEPLTPGRKLICALCLVALIVCVMPVPLRQVTA